MISITGNMIHAPQFFHAIWGQGFAILLEVSIKATVLLLLAAAMVLVFRRASAASRHLVWTLALSAAMALPVFEPILPAWNVPIFGSYPSVTSTAQRAPKGDIAAGELNAQAVPSSEDPVSSSQKWAGWILLSWVIGSALFVARMTVGEIRVRRIASRSQPLRTDFGNSILEDVRHRLHISRAVDLWISPEIGVPFTRGVFHPSIFLPEEAQKWQREQLEFVLTHELAHVCRYDCLTQVPAQIACALLWFHPLVWFAVFQIRKEREQACDDLVLNLGHPATDYAEFLLKMGRNIRKLNPAWSASIAMAQPSQLEVRMKALLDSNLNHKPLTVSRVLFAAVLTVAFLVPAAALRATAKNETAGKDTGNISGTVFGPGQEGAPGAKVTLIDLRTLKELSTSTNADGRFEFSGIQVGGYKLEITKPGFVPEVIPGITAAPSRDVVVYVNISQHMEAMPSGASRGQESGPQRIRIGRQVAVNKLIYHVPPKYPPIAKAAGIQGTVKLDAVIDKDGTVKELKVLSGHPLLVKAAIDAVRQWRFKPTLLNGVPIEVETAIELNFGLAQKSDEGSGK